MLPTNSTSQAENNSVLALIMALQIGVTQVQERLAALGEKQEVALRDTADALRHLKSTVDNWQERTSDVESRVGRLESDLCALRAQVEKHIVDHKEEDATVRADTRQRSFFVFQQSITAKQALFMAVAVAAIGLLSNVIGAALSRIFGF